MILELRKNSSCWRVGGIDCGIENGLGDIFRLGVIAAGDEAASVVHSGFTEFVKNNLPVGRGRGAGRNKFQGFKIIGVSLFEVFILRSPLRSDHKMFSLFNFFLATDFFAFRQADEIGRLNRHRNQEGREKKN